MTAKKKRECVLNSIDGVLLRFWNIGETYNLETAIKLTKPHVQVSRGAVLDAIDRLATGCHIVPVQVCSGVDSWRRVTHFEMRAAVADKMVEAELKSIALAAQYNASAKTITLSLQDMDSLLWAEKKQLDKLMHAIRERMSA